MGIYARATKRRLVPVEEGQHRAACVGVYDIGTQHSDLFKSDYRKVIIVWELPEVRVVLNKDGEQIDVPRIMSRTYTLSLASRSNLRHDVEHWRGRAFKDGEEENFDFASLLGENCILIVTHSGSIGRTFSNVAGVMPLPKGMAAMAPEGPCLSYSIDTDGEVIPDGTPKWIVEKIKASPEYQELAWVEADGGNTPAYPDQPEDTPAAVAKGEYLTAAEQDECPF